MIDLLDSAQTDSFDYSSVEAICGGSQQLMVYGFSHCGWERMLSLLSSDASPFKQIFTHELGMQTDPPPTTLEGFPMVQIPHAGSLASECKAGITNLILTNFLRKKKQQTIIPLLFLIDREQNPYPIFASDIAGRESYGDLLTHEELRRCYKLCTEFDSTPFREISEVARETIKYVKLIYDDEGHQKIALTKAPWEEPGWKEAWMLRLQTKNQPENLHWRIFALNIGLTQNPLF